MCANLNDTSQKSICTLADGKFILLRVQAYLVVSQPYPVVKEMEADDMVMEGLAFGVPSGRGKALSEHLLHQLQVRLLIEGRIKA